MAPWALLSPGVLVRTGHTVLTWGITLVLFLHDTGGGQGGADSHGSSGHPPSALQILHGAGRPPRFRPQSPALIPSLTVGARGELVLSPPPSLPTAAPAGPTLQGVPSLCAPLRPPLPLDGELRGGAQPPTLCGLPGAAAGGTSVGPVPGMVWPPVLPALGTVAAVQRAPVCHLPAALPPLHGGRPAPSLAPLPGGQQHHHLGVRLLAPHCLPPPAPRQPLRPWPDPQPGPLLLWMALRVLGGPLGRGGGGRG
ncbi:palmitoyltransferase ZDHHC12 isoform X4 [Desmodus rotundus]|uniref:palmitoyltransferase ZDHHC12 isoform X4 n=1 Tax=Desmodus rotundus TaxID=9430 RepID=UPI0039E532D5